MAFFRHKRRRVQRHFEGIPDNAQRVSPGSSDADKLIGKLAAASSRIRFHIEVNSAILSRAPVISEELLP